MKSKSSKPGKWYMTLLGGLIGLILGLIPSAASILIFNELYFIFLMFTPVLACLFIKLLGGNKNIYAILYSVLISLSGTFVAGFMLEADVVMQMYDIPKYELIRLTALMIADITNYGPQVWATITADIFNILILLGYIAIGILFSWEFIFSSRNYKLTDAEGEDSSSNSGNDESSTEFEYVYEDELEPDDEILEDKDNK